LHTDAPIRVTLDAMDDGALPPPSPADAGLSTHRSPAGDGHPNRNDALAVPGSVLPAPGAPAVRDTAPRPAPGPGPARVIELERPRSRARRALEFLGLLVLALPLVAYWHAGSPEVPVWDGWTWISHAQALSEHGLAGLWEQHPFVHTQHIYALPAFIALLLGPLVDFSFRVFALVSLACVIGTGVAFWKLGRREGLGPYAALAVFASIVSLRHFENLLSGFQMGLTLCVVLGTLAVIVADVRRDRIGLVLACALALLSASSSSAGLFALGAVVLVRGVVPGRPRVWIASVVGIVLALAVVHVVLLLLYENSFIGHFLGSLSWSTAPHVLEQTAKVLGGGLVGGTTAVPLGLALLTGGIAFAVTRARQVRRVDALLGLALFSLCSCVAIAVARTPAESPDSRYAMFAAPFVGVCAIGLLQWLQRAPAVRPLGYAGLCVGLAWTGLTSRDAAAQYQSAMDGMAFDASYAIAMTSQGVPLTHADIGLVNPGPTEEIRSKTNSTLEMHVDLPRLVYGTTDVRTVDGVLRFRGEGHVYDEYEARPDSGRSIRLEVEASCTGVATVGIIRRSADGTETANTGTPIPPRGEFRTISVRALALPGEKIHPYVYANGRGSEVVVKSFRVVLVDARVAPDAP
jgi:hypothetical protein